jgi:hypothetical protein
VDILYLGFCACEKIRMVANAVKKYSSINILAATESPVSFTALTSSPSEKANTLLRGLEEKVSKNELT